MELNRPIVLSIAGFDPCAGAGILADIKTFEQHQVYGLGINTAKTLQTEDQFISLKWEQPEIILKALAVMLSSYTVKAVKIGIVEHISVLRSIVDFIHNHDSNIKIVWDPVIKSTTGFNFLDANIQTNELLKVISKMYLITPNYIEILQLISTENAKKSAEQIAVHCNVLLKGGHNAEELGTDYLFTHNELILLKPSTIQVYPKHGSGCVLSSAITANLAIGLNVFDACKQAKLYIEKFLSSNNTLLGYHNV